MTALITALGHFLASLAAHLPALCLSDHTLDNLGSSHPAPTDELGVLLVAWHRDVDTPPWPTFTAGTA